MVTRKFLVDNHNETHNKDILEAYDSIKLNLLSHFSRCSNALGFWRVHGAVLCYWVKREKKRDGLDVIVVFDHETSDQYLG